MVLALTIEPVVALFRDLVEEGKGRTMVVGPMIVRDSASKEACCIVSCPLTSVYDVVLVAMFFI